MNYLRGAVSAISAPYQYYKDINPSTLTGAIDVIVIQRPAPNGGTELVCSPFHVRFGKWQVLRPSEKKVQVLVNGHSIPFDMKIGEAGEAFFVFETDDDVPDSLITSPIIQPTELEPAPEDKSNANAAEAEARAQELESFDLDAQSPDDQQGLILGFDADTSASHGKRRPDKLDLGKVDNASTPPAYPTPPSAAKSGPEQRADEIFQANGQLPTPEVEYKSGIALDAEGYHSRDRVRETSEDTILGSEPSHPSTSSSAGSTPQPSRSPSPEPNNSRLRATFRALSEPPPDPSSSSSKPSQGLDLLTPVQEYSWEWGSFPQPSPVVSTFNKDRLGTWGNGDKQRRRRSLNRSGSEDKGKSRLLVYSPVGEEDEDYFNQEGTMPPEVIHRSHSVPPELDGSPIQQRQELPPVSSTIQFPTSSDSAITAQTGFGAGGIVSPSRSDPTKLIVVLEGKKTEFELCVIPGSGKSLESALKVFNGRDEVTAAEIFQFDQVDYYKFLDDEEVVNHLGLVIRWGGDAYITRRDGSPLMDALILWRQATLDQKLAGAHTRPVSPTSDNELLSEDGLNDEDERYEASSERKTHNRAKSLPAHVMNAQAPQPSSSSWSQWWTRSKKQQQHQEGVLRPELRVSASEPVEVPVVSNEAERSSGSSEVQAPVPDEPSAPPGKKFAKTLRLTSDQLKALNLKMGMNNITFSLSATGAVACTASIFVWDHTEHVVISDIDGTITKSDALGHVLTMIGRDWTHLGVAKLYTDIVKNGYKIMYLTSRAIGQADSTRDYLKGIKQDRYQLPEGPVIMSPDRLMASLHREVIMRKPEMFKMACLRDIQRLFGEASRNPFYAGFGNRITDALSYRSVDVPSARIFTIDSSGEVKMELLELAGYKSSYIHMTDLVDQMFPPIHRKVAPEYTDFNYWKAPVVDYPLPDLTPPSPTLSARSETSNRSALTRIRNFSLVSPGRRETMKLAAKAAQDGQKSDDEREGRSLELRQMSSFERLSNTLSSLARASSPDSSIRSASPESNFSYHGDDDDGWDEHGNRRERRKSFSSMSMPGSLNDDDMQFDFNDEEEEDDMERGDVFHEEADEDAFDEDLELAGEMKNVPFI